MLWNSGLETGIPAIDEQHKELFRQVDILLDNGNKDRVPDTLNFWVVMWSSTLTTSSAFIAIPDTPKPNRTKKCMPPLSALSRI